jgi:uncharacterized membrane protein
MDYDPQQEEYSQPRRAKKQHSSPQEYRQGYPPTYEQSGAKVHNLGHPLGETTLKMSPRASAALSYVFWWLSGLVFLVIERKNHFVRFHAIQSILTFLVVSVVWAALRFVFSLPIIHLFGYFLLPTLGMAVFLIWAGLIIAALLGKSPRVPIIGDLAARMAGYNQLPKHQRNRHIEPGI